MTDNRSRSPDSREPFRRSESGDSYNAQGNWGAERRLDNPAGGVVPGPQGAPSGAGDGGFGPEGGYSSDASAGEIEPERGSDDRIAGEAQRPQPAERPDRDRGDRELSDRERGDAGL